MSTSPAATGDLAQQLRAFDRKVRAEIPDLLRRYQARTDAGGVCYVDQPGQRRRIRPWCDALEIALAFGLVPDSMTKPEWIATLRSFQNRATGLVPEHIPDDRPFDPPPAKEAEHEDRYVTMIVNYALEGLGSHLAHPVTNAEAISAEQLPRLLAGLNWTEGAWGAGHWIDCYASCLYPNRRYFGLGARIDQLIAWLDANVDAQSGLWGSWSKSGRWLQPVNGFYRLTRGTYAQFGRPLPQPEKAIDTILLHAADADYFADGRGNACNVLDVVHPLWLCLKQTSHRRDEAERWMLNRLPDVLTRWQPGRGMAFDAFATDHSGQPGLQGTEMWLSIVYLMATVTGLAGHLSYQPVGVHRLAPALPGAA